LARGATVRAYDPIANEEAADIYRGQSSVTLVDDLFDATEGADALVLVTEWKAFRSPDFARLKQQMAEATIFDGRNIYDPQQLASYGFSYFGIGRSN
jgi:UDPglucose 6-dehydrogenase